MAANWREAQVVMTAAPPPVQSEAELELVKRYVLLGIVMRILDHDIEVIVVSGVKLPRAYESMLRGLQDRVLLDMAGIRRRFRELGIKICEEKREAEGIRTHYVCRGYNHRFFMLWAAVKSGSELALKRYLAR